jgi:hypothetical protein
MNNDEILAARAALDAVFDKQIREDFQALRDAGFKHPKGIRFWQMVLRHGAAETARRLLRGNVKTQFGLAESAEFGMLDRSIEARVCEPQFEPLFSPAERTEAQRRLDEQRRLLAPAGGPDKPGEAVDTKEAEADDARISFIRFMRILYDGSEHPIWINPMHIASIARQFDETSYIVLSGGNELTVHVPTDVLLRRLGGANERRDAGRP